jgi:hypothetical protein
MGKAVDWEVKSVRKSANTDKSQKVVHCLCHSLSSTGSNKERARKMNSPSNSHIIHPWKEEQLPLSSSNIIRWQELHFQLLLSICYLI